MTTRNTPQQIKDQYEKLPETLKQAIYSADIAEKMFELGKKYGLTMEKIGFMSEEAGLVVLGLTPPRAFTAALAERLGIHADAAEKIALEISHEIFFPLREALKQTHQIEVGEGAMAKNEELRIPKAEQSRYGAGRNQESGQMRPESLAPAMSQPAPKIAEVKTTPQPISHPSSLPTLEVKPPPMPPVPSKTEVPKTPESPKTEIPKKMPAALRAVADDLEKEIAPLIGGIRDDRPYGFLSQKEIAELIAERQKEQTGVNPDPAPLGQGIRAGFDGSVSAPPTQKSSAAFIPTASSGVFGDIPIKKHESGIMNGEKAPAPMNPEHPAAPPPQQKNSIDLRGSAPSTPPPLPVVPINPKIPPIDLRAAPPKGLSETPPAVAPEKTKPYQGYDPYREPIE